jgi:DNA-binding MarR family transcriptional regulator
MQEIERCMLATFDMAQTVLNCLAIIDGADVPLTPSDIGERMLVSSATMTSTLDQLEYRGLVRRMPNPDDRRSMLVEITAEGKAVADRLLPGIRKIEQSVLSGLTATERATLLKLLGKVLHGAATVAGEPAITLEGRRVRPKHLR